MLTMPAIGLVALVLTSILGFLTLCEYSIVSSRRSRLREWAGRGDRGAEAALALSEQPEGFLATIRLGTITLAVTVGLCGGIALSNSFHLVLSHPSVWDLGRDVLFHTSVIAGGAISMYLCGDVIPRHIALSRPELVAVRVARPMRLLSRIAVPIERLLGVITRFSLRSFGIQPGDEPAVTEEEIKVMLEEGTKAGVFEEAEQQLVERVFRYCDRRAKALMTPRDQIAWIEMSDSPEEIRRKVMRTPHSRFPVCDQSLDNLLGVIEAKYLLGSDAVGEPWKLKGSLNLPLFLYEGTKGLRILELFRKSTTPVAIVLDEYGSVVGILTPNDILQAIVGDLSDSSEDEPNEASDHEGAARILDGRLALDEFAEMFDLPEFPRGDYDTLAGFVVTQFGRIPKPGEVLIWNRLRFEIDRMVGNRVDRVSVLPDLQAEEQER